MKRKNTMRNALVTSVISMLLCVSMLVGTTFAWFTDSVVSANNIIKSGNLDIVLEYWDGDSWEDVKGKSDILSEDLWEPGYVDVAYLRLKNAGSLALKYQLGVNIVTEKPGVNQAGAEFKLSDYIYFDVIEGVNGETGAYANRAAALAVATQNTKISAGYSKAGALEAETPYVYLALVVHMPTTVDNVANHNGTDVPQIDLGINAYATQLMSEDDSFGKDYDKDAWVDGFDVLTAQDLQAAINNGKTAIDLMADIETAESIVIPEGATVALNLNGKTLTGAGLDADGNKVHTIVNNGTLSIAGGTVKSTGTNGGSAISNNGVLTMENVTVNGAPSDTAVGTASYAVNTQGANSKLTVINCNITGRGAIGATKGTKVEINGGKYHTPAVAWGHAVYAVNEGTEVVINDGTFSEGYEMAANNWGMYQIYSGEKAKVTVNGGSFQPWDCANGYDLCTATEGTIEIYGGTFAENPSIQNGKNYVAAGCLVIDNKNGTWSVYAKDSTMTLANGATLDLGGVEFDGTVVAEGDLTIKGDTKIKTLKATSGGKITVEEGKTLTLNNFSFGAKENNTAEYVITGGDVIANYGFFQHGKYTLEADFETGYMYYSYGSDITVKGVFHSQGKGDGLDYVRGKLTIADGGKSIHDKSLWVGQPASWGAMEATLIVEKGGYVQANSLSIYDGSAMYNSAANIGVDGVGVKYNTISGEIRTTAASQEEMKEALKNADADTVIDATGVVIKDTASLNVNGATIIGATFENASGYAVSGTINGTFKDCTFESSEALRWCYSDAGTTSVFENCVIKTDFRGVHFDGMHGDIIFKNCEINGFNAIGGDGTVTFENCTFGNDKSSYNGLNMYSNITLVDCTFNYVSGKTNFIDMEGIGKTLTITNCKAYLDGVETDISNFVGGSKLAQNTVVYN